MQEQTKARVLRLLKSKLTVIAVVIVVLYTLAGFFLVPFLIGRYLPPSLSERFQSEVSLGQVKFNPYRLTVDASEFLVAEPSGAPMFGFEHLHVNFQLSSLFRWAFTFRDVILDRPSLNIVIDSDGKLNMARLTGPQPEALPDQTEAVDERKRPPRLLLYNLEINEARIEVTDARQAIPAEASLHPLTIHLSDISTIPEREGDYALTATGGDGTRLHWSGHVALHPFRSSGELTVDHLPLETPWTFFRSMVNTLPPQGELHFKTRYLVDMGADDPLARVEDLGVLVSALGLALEGEPGKFLRLPALRLDVQTIDLVAGSVDGLDLVIDEIESGFTNAPRPALQVGLLAASGATFDLNARSAAIARLEASNGVLDAILDEERSFNLVKLVDMGDLAQGAVTAESTVPEGDPWHFLVETIAVNGVSVHFSDQAVQPDLPVVSLEKIALVAHRFDGRSPFPFEAALQVAQGGAVQAAGTVDPGRAVVECDLEVNDLFLPVLQPYLAQAADLTLTSGLLSTAGAMRRTEAGGIVYQGRAAIADLAIIENNTRDILLGWSRLRTPGMRLSLDPDGFEMDTLNLSGLQVKLIIAEDGTVNVSQAFNPQTGEGVEAPPRQEAPDPPGQVFPVSIRRVNLDTGMLHFADLSLIPPFDTRIHELKGTVTGISSRPGTRTEVDLDGSVDRYGSSRITGAINFFDPKEHTDIAMVFKNLEMTNFTSYSGKFAGRKIDAGRLSLDLHYLIEHSRLASHNEIIIDALVLGERVESPDAVSLPLGLAVALLTDANGIIHIGLPVTGSLEDPEFRLGPLIRRALFNLLTRIATSPFRALAALIGGTEETLDRVLFDPGADVIPPTEREKLDKLVQALSQRPKLALVVSGRYDPVADGRVLKALQVRQVVAERSGFDLTPGEDPGPLDFGHADTQTILEELFVERYGQEAYDQLLADMSPAGEEDAAQEEESPPVEPAQVARRLFAALSEGEALAPGVLERLGDARAAAVAAHVTGPDALAPERITVRPSESAGEGEPAAVMLDLESI